MSNIDKQALRLTAEKAQEHGVFNMDIHSQTVLSLLDELEAKDKRIAELEAQEVELPPLKMLSDYLAEVTMREREDILVGVRLEFHQALKSAGIKIAAGTAKGE